MHASWTNARRLHGSLCRFDSGPLRNDSGNLEAVLVVTGCLDGRSARTVPSGGRIPARLALSELD